MVPIARARTMNSGVRFFITARFCAASAITSWHEAQCLAYRSAPSGAAALATTVAQKTRMILRDGRMDTSQRYQLELLAAIAFAGCLVHSSNLRGEAANWRWEVHYAPCRSRGLL